MGRERIINQGSIYRPHWVVFDRALRNIIIESDDFDYCVQQLDMLEEKEQRRYECSNGSCED